VAFFSSQLLSFSFAIYQGLYHTLALAIYIKKYILLQKTKYANSNTSPCKNYNLQKILLREKP
jgi:hypothetical protein